jgi:hypothetical protein
VGFPLARDERVKGANMGTRADVVCIAAGEVGTTWVNGEGRILE